MFFKLTKFNNSIINKNIKSLNYTLETINKNIYIFGIATDENEKKEIKLK